MEKKVVEHGGGITGFVSYIKRIPEDETCIVILDNQPNSANTIKMAQDIADMLSGKDVRLPKARVAITLDTALLRQYVGQYQIGPNSIFVISLEDGHLYGQATGQGKMELFAEKKDLFFINSTHNQHRIIYFKRLISSSTSSTVQYSSTACHHGTNVTTSMFIFPYYIHSSSKLTQVGHKSDMVGHRLESRTTIFFDINKYFRIKYLKR